MPIIFLPHIDWHIFSHWESKFKSESQRAAEKAGERDNIVVRDNWIPPP